MAIMRLIKISVLVIQPILWYISSAVADLPPTIEDLLTAQNRWRADLGINYANSTHKNISVGEPLLLQITPTQFIALPASISESRVNSDVLALSPGLRYGLSGKTELYGRGTWLNESTRIQNNAGTQTESDNRFQSVWLGINHKFIAEGKTPALLGFAEFAALENNKLANSENLSSAKSWVVGATTYRVIDPIVLSLTAAYGLNLNRDIDGTDYKPGNYFVVNPSVAFAVNNEITLSGGLQWINTNPTEINHQTQGIRQTNTSFNAGLSWLWDERSTLNLIVRANISGNSNAGIGLNWSYKLGDLQMRNTK